MAYVRAELGIPVPQVYHWSSSKKNPVGAEYILMERCQGVELNQVWDTMSEDDQRAVVRTIVSYESALEKVAFPIYGGLYYAKDLDGAQLGQNIRTQHPSTPSYTFAIGPTAEGKYVEDGRDAMEVNRGPWSSIVDFLSSRAQREFACLQKYSTFPAPLGLYGGPKQYKPDKRLKIGVLRWHLQVMGHILPRDRTMTKPVLSHGDLHGGNIFVDPQEPTKVLNIIDWQAVSISPLFTVAERTPLVDYVDLVREGLRPDGLPESYDDMSTAQQQQAREFHSTRTLFALWEAEMSRQCPEYYKDTLPAKILWYADHIFSDGEMVLWGSLIQLQDEWESHAGPSVTCPLRFGKDDKLVQRYMQEKWERAVQNMIEVCATCDVPPPWDGWVKHEDFSRNRAHLEQAWDDYVDICTATDEERRQALAAWPFRNKDKE